MLSSSNTQTDGDKSHVTLVKRIGEFIPKLSSNMRKGQCGRIGILGGSTEYTGAPFYTALSALRTGADLAYVFCCQAAGTVIKSYSPELIVIPILDLDNAVRTFEPYIQKLHALVIGPGLGKDLAVLRNVVGIMNLIKERNNQLPLVIDADGLSLISDHLALIREYKGPIILTPNAPEFERLRGKVTPGDTLQVAMDLGVIIVQKGRSDLIANGACNLKQTSKMENFVVNCDIPGSHRRCGGQGDILAGCIATFTAWFSMHLADVKPAKTHEENMLILSGYLGYALPAYAGCAVTRSCSRLAYKDFGRSALSSDMISYVSKAFRAIFGP